MSGAETVVAVLATLAILVSVIVGAVNHYAAKSAEQSAQAAKEQAASSERQANAAWEQVKVAYRHTSSKLTPPTGSHWNRM